MRTATKQEAINGNSNDTVITPLRLKQVLSNADINPGEGGGSSDAPVYTAGEGISIINNVISNTITNISQLVNDSNFITEEEILDPVPVNSIFDYEGDTVPDGFIEIDPLDIPTKTSELDNDSGFINQIKTINGQSLVGEGDITIEGGTGGSGGSTPLEIETVNVPILTGLNTDNPNLVIDDFITARKCGNICTLTIVGGSGISIKNRESKTIATLPEGYRPIQNLGGPVTLKVNDQTWDAVGKSQLIILANGQINLQQYTGSNFNYIMQLVGNYTYFTNE